MGEEASLVRMKTNQAQVNITSKEISKKLSINQNSIWEINSEDLQERTWINQDQENTKQMSFQFIILMSLILLEQVLEAI